MHRAKPVTARRAGTRPSTGGCGRRSRRWSRRTTCAQAAASGNGRAPSAAARSVIEPLAASAADLERWENEAVASRAAGCHDTESRASTLSVPEPEHLRVLVANQRPERLDHVTTIVVSLGHEVIARSIEVTEVAAVTSRERPDVALVGLGDSSDHALELIGEIVRQAACPVIALLETDDHAFVTEAAKRGVFAYITSAEADQLQDSLAIVLRRFAEFQNLEGAFGRRALIERAKGILMERHAIDEETCLRDAAYPCSKHQSQAHCHRRRGRRRAPSPPPQSGRRRARRLTPAEDRDRT